MIKYNALNQLLTATDPSSNTTTYEYYPDTRALQKTTYPPPQGAGGQVTGITTTYTYDSQRG